MLALRRWRASHLFLAWGTWWAGVALVTLTPAIRALSRLAGPGQHGSASVGFGDGTLSMSITNAGQTVWSSAIDLSTLALWFAGPPLLLWLVWLPLVLGLTIPSSCTRSSSSIRMRGPSRYRTFSRRISYRLQIAMRRRSRAVIERRAEPPHLVPSFRPSPLSTSASAHRRLHSSLFAVAMSPSLAALRRLSLACLVAAPLARGDAQYAVPARALDPANVDRKFGACQDFYMFANNGWIENHPIPPEFSGWGSFNELTERNNLVLKDVIEKAAREAPTTSDPNTKKLGTFYTSCMDSTAAETAGIAPLGDELSRIAAITDRAQLRAEIARMHSLGFGGTFGFGSAADAKNATMVIANASQGGISLPDRDYYLRDDPSMQTIRAKYLNYIRTLFGLAGEATDAAAADAQRVLALETALAKAQVSRIAQRDPNSRYHFMSLAQANAMTPGFDWSEYLSSVGLPQVTSLNVGTPVFFTALALELGQRPLDDWKVYLRWMVVSRNAPVLSAPFVNAAFAFNSVLTGAIAQQPRWKRCLAASDRALGDALGREYVKVVFTPEAKDKMLGMVKNLRAVLRDRISRADWMSETTRAQALQKMDSFNQKIGYPDTWRDYADLAVEPGAFVNNALRVRTYETRRDFAEIGKPLDRSRWGMTPPTVNAYYSPPLNEIVFPAGRLQPPFFSVTYDDAANYGGVGGTIGHEMSHGFDDSGRMYDAQGNLRDWWTPQDASRYTARAKVVEDQYGAYVAIDTLHLNGKLTLGENLADVVGVSVAFEAMERALTGKPRTLIDGFTPEQRFFLAYAQARLAVMRPEAARVQVATDPHSPGPFRVNGPLSNMPEFAQAFGCRAGDPMVRPESLRARIW